MMGDSKKTQLSNLHTGLDLVPLDGGGKRRGRPDRGLEALRGEELLLPSAVDELHPAVAARQRPIQATARAGPGSGGAKG